MIRDTERLLASDSLPLAGLVSLVAASTLNGLTFEVSVGTLRMTVRPDQVILLLLLPLLSVTLVQRRLRWHRTRADLPVLGLLITNALASVLFSPLKRESLQGVALLAFYVSMYFVTVQLSVRCSHRFDWLIKAFVGLGVLHALYGTLALLAHGWGGDIGGITLGQVMRGSVTVRGAFVEPNLLATYLGIIFLFLATYLLFARRNRAWWFAFVSLLLVGQALILTLTRGAWLAAALGVAFLVLSVLARATDLRQALAQVSPLLLAVLLVLVISIALFDPLLSRLWNQEQVLAPRVASLLMLSRADDTMDTGVPVALARPTTAPLGHDTAVAVQLTPQESEQTQAEAQPTVQEGEQTLPEAQPTVQEGEQTQPEAQPTVQEGGQTHQAAPQILPVGETALAGDLDGDGRGDLVVWQPSNGLWYRLTSSSGYGEDRAPERNWGQEGDIPVSSDLDGDGKMDLVVWRPSNGFWHGLTSSGEYADDQAFARNWGQEGDIPVSSDLDGDGKADLVVWRPSDGFWYGLTSSSGYSVDASFELGWGHGGDIPLSSDLDGDGRMDLVVWRPSNGFWYGLTSSSGYSVEGALERSWGQEGDTPLAGDVDGDERMDLVVWRPSDGFWYGLTSSSGYSVDASFEFGWGQDGDMPVSGDLDGDGRMDLVVWRPGNGFWYGLTSSSGYAIGQALQRDWGGDGDRAPSAGSAQQVQTESLRTAIGRLQTYRYGLSASLERPFFGHGTFAGEVIGNRWWMSSLVQAQYDTGILGTTFLIWMHGAVVLSAWLAYKQSAAPFAQSAFLALSFGNALMFVTSQLSSALWVGFPWVFMGLTVGLSEKDS